MRIFSPKRYVASVDRIDLDELWANGKRAILLDRDNTLVPRDTEVVPPAVVEWLDAARDRGFKLCMVSNNWHRDQVMASASKLGDQLYTDVWAGNFAGVDTVLVKPQATTDLWYTQIFRIFERRALRDLECEE